MNTKKIVSFATALTVAFGAAPSLCLETISEHTGILKVSAEDYSEVTAGNLIYHVYPDHAVVSLCKKESVTARIDSEIEGVPVTSVGSNAFENCEKLVSVTIPEGISIIEDYAFDSCSSLTTIKLPSTVTQIESGAFKNCTKLSSFKFPSGISNVHWFS